MLGRYRYQSIRNGLVGHWRPSRGPTGNTLIDSVSGNHGTLVNGPTWTASGSGYALSLNGTSNYGVGSQNISVANKSFTVSYWAFVRGFQALAISVPRTAATYDTLLIRHNADNQLRFSFYAYDLDATVLSHVNRWSNFVCVYENGVGKYVYQDGRLAGSNAQTLPCTAIGLPTFGFWNVGGQYFNGLMDDIAIFNWNLSAGQILALYTAGRGALDQRVNVPVVRGFDPGVGSGFKPYWAARRSALIGCGA